MGILTDSPFFNFPPLAPPLRILKGSEGFEFLSWRTQVFSSIHEINLEQGAGLGNVTGTQIEICGTRTKRWRDAGATQAWALLAAGKVQIPSLTPNHSFSPAEIIRLNSRNNISAISMKSFL
jgi:hypothetical protein